jgi:hypothetical protein
LGKPSITAGTFCFNDQLTVSWKGLGGTSEYKVSYLFPMGGNWISLATVPIKHGDKSYSYFVDVSSWHLVLIRLWLKRYMEKEISSRAVKSV